MKQTREVGMRGRWGFIVGAMLLAIPMGRAADAGEAPSPLRARVAEVLAGRRPLREVRIEAFWTKPGKHHLLVWGSGVGVWNQQKQFELSDKDVRSLLELLLERGYFEMPDMPKPAPSPASSRGPQAAQVLRAVGVKVGELSKLVSQNNRVLTFQPLEELVGELFARCERLAAKGVEAKDLDDGLEKIAKGILAVETLTITVSEPPLPAGPSRPAVDGLIVKLEEGEMARILQPVGGELKESRWRVEPDTIRQLAERVRQVQFSQMPPNLYRPRHVEVQVAVLNHKKFVQARTFAGMEADAKKAQQAELEGIVKHILAMQAPGAAAREKID